MDPSSRPSRGRGRGRGAGAVTSINDPIVGGTPTQSSSASSPEPTPESFTRHATSTEDETSSRRFPPSSSVGSLSGRPSPFGLGGVGRGRGRGLGLMISKDVFEDSSSEDDVTPASTLRRERENPIPSDSDSEDDFVATFRNLSTMSSSGGLALTRGRGRGRGIAVVDSPVPDRLVAERGSRIVRPAAGISISSPSPSSSSSNPDTSASIATDSSGDMFSELERSVVVMKGKVGQSVPLCANFIRINILRNCGLFEYHVDFDPVIESRRFKRNILSSSVSQLGSVINFDGAKLYLPNRLSDRITEFTAAHPADPSSVVTVRVQYVKANSLEGCTHFYNILLRRVMDKLGFIEMQRNFYDYTKIFSLPIHKLEIWPGFVTAIDVFEGGLMLNCDASFRILKTETIWDALQQFINLQSETDYRQRFKDFVLNQIILTKYNNKHYRIDDVDWERSPLNTFPITRRGQMAEITFVEYYQNNYGIPIHDHNQPLLVTRSKPRRNGNLRDNGVDMIRLIPELCYLTGITDDIRSNYQSNKAVTEQTRIAPAQRHNALKEFIRKVRETPEAYKEFSNWGLEIDSGLVSLQGRQVCPPEITFNERHKIQPQRGDFSRELLKSNILEPIPVGNYLIVCTSQDDSKAKRLIQTYSEVSPPLGIHYLSQPQICIAKRPTPQEFRQTLLNNIQLGRTQFVIVIIPTARDDLYQVIKTICTKERPIPSQVIRSKTLSDERKLRSIIQKVALQINCKLGGGLWTIRIPLPDKIMFLGMDVYHDIKNRPSVTAVVASINLTYTKYYTRAIFQSPGQEMIVSLRPVFHEALVTFYEENKAFPDRIIMFRDGVGDGQLDVTRENEVSQMLSTFQELGIEPKFTFCVVQKRINAKLFLEQGSYITNPEPGTIIDHTITRRYHYDFFLVSQLIREGTVNPTHYIVLHDNANMKPDNMQKFAYATSYMYYNWAGSIRVPAMCQYAHKAASLVGQHLRSEPSRELAKQLYYL